MVPYYSRNILAGEDQRVQKTPVPAYIYRSFRAPVLAVMSIRAMQNAS